MSGVMNGKSYVEKLGSGQISGRDPGNVNVLGPAINGGAMRRVLATSSSRQHAIWWLTSATLPSRSLPLRPLCAALVVGTSA